MIDPFPIPLIIIGGKYDLFQVCSCIAYVGNFYPNVLPLLFGGIFLHILI